MTKKIVPIEDKLDEHGLTIKEREFADYYRGGDQSVRGNAKRCYMLIHPKAAERSAEVEASKMLRKPEIVAYLKLKSQEVAEECGVNAKWLLERLVEEATADVADIYTKEGALKPIHEWPKIWRQGLVGGLETQQQFEYIDGQKSPDGFFMKLKLSDRIKRLELIGKHVDIQAFREKEVAVGLTVIIEDKDAKA